MNTIICLLIVNLIMNIFIIFNIFDIKYNINKSEKIGNEKNKSSFVTKLKNTFADFDYDDDIEEAGENNFKVIEDNTARRTSSKDRLEKLRKQWYEEDKEEDFKMYKYTAFRDVYEFMQYVSSYNLDIVDISTGKVKRIKFLDKVSYFDKDKCKYQETVKITFDDGSSDLFMPNKFSRLSYVNAA